MTRRPTERPGDEVWKLGSLTVSVAGRACHACGRQNAGLTFCRETRPPIDTFAHTIVICQPCLQNMAAAYVDYLDAAIRRGTQ